MGIFDFIGGEKDLHDEYHSTHQASLTGELLTGAATYAAIHKYESDQRAQGKEVTHAGLKEAGGAIAAAFIEREVSTKGLDFIDHEKAKRDAKKRVNEIADQYGDSY